jgi:uncharacterized protein
MSSSILIEKDVPVKMRDGITLRADVYRPDDKAGHPAILMRSPYDAAGMLNVEYYHVLPIVQAGYALVFEYVRGRFNSEGQWDVGSSQKTDGPDGYDSVEWTAAQPWCDGNVGMAGLSYLGMLQWRAACENPPHLKAIAPAQSGAPGEIQPAVWDSVLTLNMAVSWPIMMAVNIVSKLEQQGQDVSEMRRLIERAAADPAEVYNYLPLKDVPQFNFKGLREMWEDRLYMFVPGPDSDLRNPYPFERVSVPGLHISGWFDPFTRRTFHSYLSMRQRGGSPFAREHQHIFVGPWCHGNPTRVSGHVDFGAMADGPGAGANQYLLSFFDKYLRGREVHLPAVRYFTMGRNTWHGAEAWPLPRTQWQRFYLHSREGANSCRGDGLLSRDEPAQEAPDTYVYNPNHPVPTAGGRGMPAENGFLGGAVDQHYVESRADVLCYTTPALAEDMEVTGPLVLHLQAATSCRDTDFTAKVVDVYPDGRAYNLANGIVRAQYRNSIFSPQPVTPGEVIEYTIYLGPTSQLFRKGHRIRLDVSSSNFPENDRNLNTGHRIGEDAAGIPALQTIYHQAGYASYIDLPVIPER